ncbi:MAG: isocitrate lyase/phosphoenolpyruvate mutase family protein [bacterium]|nr:isocitrate lyase/phosphoenolpyruvate mutase family protein [bacterium]
MKKQNDPGKRLLHVLAKAPIAVPGTFYPFGALQIQAAGFPACYLSGAALSTSLGLLDEGLLTSHDVSEATRNITRVVDIPVIVDCDTGLLEPITHGQMNPRILTVLMAQAGAAAIQLEDQISAKKRCGHLDGKRVVSEQAMVAKIAYACEARYNGNLLIIARTDSRAPEGLDAAIRRAHAYVHAGADAIFPEALESLDEFRTFRESLPDAILLANLAEHGKTPANIRAEDLWEIGYEIVLFPVTGTRAMYRAHQDVLDEIAKTGSVQRSAQSGIMPRQAVNKLITDQSRPYQKK